LRQRFGLASTDGGEFSPRSVTMSFRSLAVAGMLGLGVVALERRTYTAGFWRRSAMAVPMAPWPAATVAGSLASTTAV